MTVPGLSLKGQHPTRRTDTKAPRPLTEKQIDLLSPNVIWLNVVSGKIDNSTFPH